MNDSVKARRILRNETGATVSNLCAYRTARRTFRARAAVFKTSSFERAAIFFSRADTLALSYAALPATYSRESIMRRAVAIRKDCDISRRPGAWVRACRLSNTLESTNRCNVAII